MATQEQRLEEGVELAEIGGISAVGGLWFDTAISKLKFAGKCCQQVAGCCQRVSRSVKPADLLATLRR